MDNERMLLIMDNMKTRLKFIREIRNHSYFFTQPNYETKLVSEFKKKCEKSAERNIKTLQELKEVFKSQIGNPSSFTALEVSKQCSQVLF